MMTLLPMAAFAASPSRYASTFEVDKTNVAADGETELKATVYVFGTDNKEVVGQAVYFATDRETTDIAKYTYVETDKDGKAELKFTSSVIGETTVYAGLNKEVYEYANGIKVGGEVVTATDAGLIGNGREVTFVAPAVDKIEVVGTPGTAIANGLEAIEITFRVVAEGGAPVANENVEFSVNKTSATLNKTEATTNNAGIAKVKVYATKSGDYKVEAKAAGERKEATVTFGAGGNFDLAVQSGANEVVALDKSDFEFKIKLMDVNGNKNRFDGKATDTAKLYADANYKVKVEMTKRPSDVRIVEKPYDNGTGTNYKVATDADGFIVVTFGKSVLNKEGAYNARVSLDNGKYVDVPFEVKKQGDIVKLELSYKQEALGLDATSSKATVKRIDANGVAAKLDDSQIENEITFSLNDWKKVQSITDLGAITATNDADFVGPLTVTAIDTKEDLTASFVIEIGAEANSIKLDDTKANVNETAVVPVRVIDRNGNPIALGASSNVDADVDVTVYVLSKPAGAIVATDLASQFVKNLEEKGVAAVEVDSNKAGEVKVQVVVKYNGKYFTDDAMVTFGVAPADKPGAGKVTLFIGQQVAVVDGAASLLDVAPFIKDGRTFVPVRFIAEALGAEVKYDAATQVVTATRGDDVVVMTIGSNVMTVNGEAQVTDVAPFIVDGRTVLPFRALAEAFGSEVAWDAATQSVVFEK